MASLATRRILQSTTRVSFHTRPNLSTLASKRLPPTLLPSSQLRSLATLKDNETKELSKDPKPTSLEPPPETAPIIRKRQAIASLDFEPEDQSARQSLITDGTSSGVEGQKRTGAKSAKDSLSSIERRRRRMGWVSAFGLIGSLIGTWVYLGWEDEGEPGIGAWITRSNKNTLKMFDLFDKPIWDKLLPDPLPAGYQRPYTLIVSIDDLLVSSTWDRQNGWRTAKRPGLDYFLGYLSQFYEVVIFTTQSSQTSIPIIEQLDPYQYYFLYHLFRESTRTHKGVMVKDLSYLNRDLSKVIAIDTVADRYSLHPDNVIVLPKWKPGTKGRGEAGEGDLGLAALIPFLESMAFFEVPDVRPIINKYKGKDIAKEYAEIEAANKKRIVEQWEATHKNAHGLAAGGWTISRLFGQAPPPPTMPLSFLDQRRAQAQEMYKRDLEELEKMKPELQRRKALAQEEGMKEMMEGGVFGILSRMGLGPKLPESSIPGQEGGGSGPLAPGQPPMAPSNAGGKPSASS